MNATIPRKVTGNENCKSCEACVILAVNFIEMANMLSSIVSDLFFAFECQMLQFYFVLN